MTKQYHPLTKYYNIIHHIHLFSFISPIAFLACFYENEKDKNNQINRVHVGSPTNTKYWIKFGQLQLTTNTSSYIHLKKRKSSISIIGKTYIWQYNNHKIQLVCIFSKTIINSLILEEKEGHKISAWTKRRKKRFRHGRPIEMPPSKACSKSELGLFFLAIYSQALNNDLQPWRTYLGI